MGINKYTTLIINKVVSFYYEIIKSCKLKNQLAGFTINDYLVTLRERKSPIIAAISFPLLSNAKCPASNK